MSLTATLIPASFLLEPARSNERPSNLPSVLIARLKKYEQATGSTIFVNESDPVAAVQTETAKQLLLVVENCQRILLEAPDAGIGTKDFSTLQTSISVVFNWGLKHLHNSAANYWQNTSGPSHQLEDVTRLSRFLRRILSTVLPSEGADLRPSFITNVILSKYPSELLQYTLTLGWSSEPWGSAEDLRYFRTAADSLLTMYVLRKQSHSGVDLVHIDYLPPKPFLLLEKYYLRGQFRMCINFARNS